ncbi:MAG: hypothetical protein HY457_01245 [Parcubacteria group bacterium]|nr:hypothetical protein [Parcubacteria group bacterium]
MKPWLLNIFCGVVVALMLPFAANAGVAGLYYPTSGDKVTLVVNEATKRPVLRIEVSAYQNLDACHGFQVYRFTPFRPETLKVANGPVGMGTGFALWESRECTEAYSAAFKESRPLTTKKLVQEIDIYNDFFSYFTNRDELIRDFEAGKFVLALGFQENAGTDDEFQEVVYGYGDALAGTVLISR